VDLFPPSAEVREHLRRKLAQDTTGLYRCAAAGRTGRSISLIDTLRAELAHPGIRPAIDLSSGSLFIVVSVDACEMTKQTSLTLAGHRILNIPGAFVRRAISAAHPCV
jgi:hypothetical protein